MGYVGKVIYLVALIYLILLMVRMVFGWISMFARDFKPRGFGLVVLESVFTATDQPLTVLRRFIKPVRIGPIGLDIAFMLVVLLVIIVMQVAVRL